jgi:hypothetical protein
LNVKLKQRQFFNDFGFDKNYFLIEITIKLAYFYSLAYFDVLEIRRLSGVKNNKK